MQAAVSVGDRVVRGPDWNKTRREDGHGDGKVVELVMDRYGPYARVNWDNGKSGLYRNGYKDKYDLKVAPPDVLDQTSILDVSSDIQRRPSVGSAFLECELCNKKYKSKTAFSLHMKTRHPPPSESESEEEEEEPAVSPSPPNTASSSRSNYSRSSGTAMPSRVSSVQRRKRSEPEMESPVPAKSRRSTNSQAEQVNKTQYAAELMEVNNFTCDEEESFGRTIAMLMRPVHPSRRATVMAQISQVISDHTDQE